MEAKQASASLRVDPLNDNTVEVNPNEKTPLKEEGARFANTKRKAAAQLIDEGIACSFVSCAAYMTKWIELANDNDLKTTFIQGKKNAKGRPWKLIIVTEEPEDITPVNEDVYEKKAVERCKAEQ